MPSTDQDIFDMFDSITESIEAHFDSMAQYLQDTFRTTPWLPDSVKPRPPPPSYTPPVMQAPVGYFEGSRIWISEHRAVTAAVIAFFGTGAFITWRRRNLDRAKRRAKRAKNGARTEVVILAGSPHSPITRSLSQDLERRGFIVYIPVNSLLEEQLIQAESRPDIRPLSLDITSPLSTEETVRKLSNHLSTPQQPIPNASTHKLHLAAFILLPSPNYFTGSISTLHPSVWSDTLNTHLLAPFTTLHAFFPLLISQNSTLLCLTPCINPSLAPPSHAPESVVTFALRQYISTLQKELSPQTVNVVHMQLGHFDYGPNHAERQQLVQSSSSGRAEATKLRLEKAGIIKHSTGSSLRELHNGVFDAIVRGKGRNSTLYVGRGSRLYVLVGKWVPGGVIGWMMGTGKAPVVERDSPEEAAEGSVEWEKVEGS